MDHPLQEELHFLLEKSRAGQASGEDYRKLVALVNADRTGTVIEEINAFLENEHLDAFNHVEPYDYEYWQQAFLELKQANQTKEAEPAVVHRLSPLRRWWVAAGIVLAIGLGSWWWLRQTTESVPVLVSVNTQDVPPGHEGAVLTLADGSIVMLDSLKNTTIALQGGAFAKVINGTLVYEGTTGKEVAYNTMSTPKGRQFQLILPDGSQVWLNSASSIRYPTLFTGNKRQVEIQGEVYFEVAKNKQFPFNVKVSNNMEVEVVGTHFNINAYKNEANISTTLLEGKVKVNGVMISPGQQAQLGNTNSGAGDIKIVANADTAKIMAWKKGLFNFQNASLEEILRQLERWYDIQVVYEQGIPDVELTGEMTRNISLNTLLRLLKDMGLEYRMEGAKLLILPSKNKT